MIDRIAKIFDYAAFLPAAPFADDLRQVRQQIARDRAREVLQAMTDPTEAMKWAGTQKACDYHAAEVVWEAMIEAALAEDVVAG